MINKRGKLETALLAVALVTVSGACLAYNIYTAESTELTLSLRELAVYSEEPVSGEVISAAAMANLNSGAAVEVSAAPSDDIGQPRLLPPVVKPAG